MYVDILILAHLVKQPNYGFEIKKRVERVLGGTVSLNNNLLYPALRRFEEMGAVRRAVEHREGKMDRHVYHLTETGMQVLQSLLREFPPQQARNEVEFLTRVAFFDLLDPPTRLDILAARRAALRQHREHLTAMEHAAREGQSDYGVQVIALVERQIETETAWLDALTSSEERHVSTAAACEGATR